MAEKQKKPERRVIGLDEFVEAYKEHQLWLKAVDFESLVKTPEGRGRLRYEGQCGVEESDGKRMDFSSCDLSEVLSPRNRQELREKLKLKKEDEIDFRGATLSYANFQRARLPNANFHGAYLYSANFQKADLYSANFQKAYLSNANFQRAYLPNANFHGAYLYSANFQKAFLHNANFQKADLHNANFQRAILHNANFQKALLYRAKFHGVDFRKTDLKGVSFSGGVEFCGANLSEMDLRKLDLWDVRFWEMKDGKQVDAADLAGARLEKAKLKKEVLKLAETQGAKLGWTNWLRLYLGPKFLGVVYGATMATFMAGATLLRAAESYCDEWLFRLILSTLGHIAITFAVVIILAFTWAAFRRDKWLESEKPPTKHPKN